MVSSTPGSFQELGRSNRLRELRVARGRWDRRPYNKTTEAPGCRRQPALALQEKCSRANRRRGILQISWACLSGDQLFPRGRVYSVVARRNCWRAGDAHVHFSGSCFAYHADDFAGSGAAHDGSSTRTTRLPSMRREWDWSFSLTPEISDGLRRLDEGSADVMMRIKPMRNGNAGFHGVATAAGTPNQEQAR